LAPFRTHPGSRAASWGWCVSVIDLEAQPGAVREDALAGSAAEAERADGPAAVHALVSAKLGGGLLTHYLTLRQVARILDLVVSTPAEVLAEAKRCAVAGRISYTMHAVQRMSQRGVQQADVRCALMNAQHARAGETAGSWRIDGQDLDRDDLTVVVVFESGVLVVTVF
jgi:Domain of unknown function (DUF4258)